MFMLTIVCAVFLETLSVDAIEIDLRRGKVGIFCKDVTYLLSVCLSRLWSVDK